MKDEKQEILDVDEESQEASSSSFIFREGIFVVVLSASAYFSTYFFERTYLAYFGYSQDFVEITLDDVLVLGASVASTFIFLWYALSFLPVSFVTPFMKLLALAVPCYSIFALTKALYDSVGYGWLTISMFFGFLLVTFLTFRGLFGVAAGRTRFSDWLGREYDEDLEFKKKFSSYGLLFHKNITVGLGIILLLALPLAGQLFGLIYASTKKSFTVVSIGQQEYAIVSDYSDGFLLTAVSTEKSADTPALLPDAGKWLPLSEMTDVRLSVRVFPDGLSVARKRQNWVTFKVFWERNFGSELPDRP